MGPRRLTVHLRRSHNPHLLPRIQQLQHILVIVTVFTAQILHEHPLLLRRIDLQYLLRRVQQIPQLFIVNLKIRHLDLDLVSIGALNFVLSLKYILTDSLKDPYVFWTPFDRI